MLRYNRLWNTTCQKGRDHRIAVKIAFLTLGDKTGQYESCELTVASSVAPEAIKRTKLLMAKNGGDWRLKKRLLPQQVVDSQKVPKLMGFRF